MSESAPGPVRTVHVLVTGRVQGVGFRWACQEEAQRLGVVGQVRNLADGDVEVMAQGPESVVGAFIGWLRKGPRWASVSGLRVTDLAPGSLADGEFSVRS